MVNLYWVSKAPWLRPLEDQGITASLEFSRYQRHDYWGVFSHLSQFVFFDILTEIHICILLYCTFVVNFSMKKINSKSK